MLDLLVLVDDVFQRCLSAQLDPTALQRSNRCKCAHLLRGLDATVDLPPQCSLLALQLLSPRAPTLRRRMSSPLRQRLTLALNGTPPGTQTRLHSCGQILSSLDLLTALAATLGWRQPHNVPPLHTGQVVHEVVSEEYRILDTLNYEMTVFTLNVEHLRQRVPEGTGSWLSLLARPIRGIRKHGPASGKGLCP